MTAVLGNDQPSPPPSGCGEGATDAEEAASKGLCPHRLRGSLSLAEARGAQVPVGPQQPGESLLLTKVSLLNKAKRQMRPVMVLGRPTPVPGGFMQDM